MTQLPGGAAPPIGQTEMERILMRLSDRVTSLESRVQFGLGGIKFNVAGAWSASAPPNGTSGTAFTVPASGRLWADVDLTAYTTNAGVGLVYNVYVDGVYRANATLASNLTANVHLSLSPAVFSLAVTAGTHYLWVHQVAGTSDANDRLSFSGIVLPQ